MPRTPPAEPADAAPSIETPARWLRPDWLEIFVRVAERSSFSQAAVDLGLPKARVSTAVRQLEAQLGTRLFHRTTRKVQTTHDGQSWLERCKDVLADLDEMQTMFERSEGPLHGRVRIDMPHSLARRYVLPRLPHLLARHPQLELELGTNDRRVDLVREGYDFVLRVGTLVDSSLVARRLGLLRMINLASPTYLAAHGTPTSLADLPAHRLVHYTPALGTRPDGFEHLQDGRPAWVPMAGSVSVNGTDAYTSACLCGLGIIQVPAIGMQHYLDNGQLVELLPEHVASPMPLSLVHAHRRQLSRRVRVVMDWVAEILAPELA